MKDDKLLAQGVVFLSAGFESSSSVISFSLYEMCLNKDIQNKLRNEIKTVLAKHNNELSYECVAEMVYLDMVVSGGYNIILMTFKLTLMSTIYVCILIKSISGCWM